MRKREGCNHDDAEVVLLMRMSIISMDPPGPGARDEGIDKDDD